MQTTVKLGCLPVLVEADDYQELVRQAWKIARLNEAITQEDFDPSEWMPYCEEGADGNEYAGFAHLSNGKRIRLGKTKAGDWYVRGKGTEHYRPPEDWGSGSNQLEAHEEKPKVEGKGKKTPASNGADYEKKLKNLYAYLDNSENLDVAIKKAYSNVSRYPDKWKKKAENIIQDFKASLKPSGDFDDESDLPF